MAVGEFVSVSSQRDLEHADIRREKWELENNWEGEVEELSLLYEVRIQFSRYNHIKFYDLITKQQERGVERQTAQAVANQLMAKDALRAHAIDELGIRDFTKV